TMPVVVEKLYYVVERDVRDANVLLTCAIVVMRLPVPPTYSGVRADTFIESSTREGEKQSMLTLSDSSSSNTWFSWPSGYSDTAGAIAGKPSPTILLSECLCTRNVWNVLPGARLVLSVHRRCATGHSQALRRP